MLQTNRLGAQLAARCDVIGPVRHLFASDLQRAYKTAQAIADAQKDGPPPRVVRVSDIREKDFGSMEGKKTSAIRTAEDRASVEPRASVEARIGRFVDEHLAPLFQRHAADDIAIVVVSHGLVLGPLIRALQARYPSEMGSTNPQPSSGADQHIAWNNTGVLQAKLVRRQSKATRPEPASPLSATQAQPSSRMMLQVQFVNNVDHLQGLRKTRGGIGSAKFDSRQRTMKSFFGSAGNKSSPAGGNSAANP